MWGLEKWPLNMLLLDIFCKNKTDDDSGSHVLLEGDNFHIIKRNIYSCTTIYQTSLSSSSSISFSSRLWCSKNILWANVMTCLAYNYAYCIFFFFEFEYKWSRWKFQNNLSYWSLSVYHIAKNVRIKFVLETWSITINIYMYLRLNITINFHQL